MNRRHARAGFSLIEMLVVMTIMAVIVGLLFRASLGTSDSARIASTRATITKLDSVLKQRIDALHKRSLRNAAASFTAAYNSAGNTPVAIAVTNERVAEVFMRKLEYRSLFPQRLEDLFGIDGTANTADDAYLLSVWLAKTGGVLLPPNHDRKHESAKLLYLALMENQDELTDSINPRHIAYLDKDDRAMDLKSFVDDWGNALRFYNWPTRLIRPDGEGASIDQTVYSRTAASLVAIAPPATPSPYPYPSATSGTAVNAINQDPDDPRLVFSLAKAGGYFNAPFDLVGFRPMYRRSSANTTSAPAVTVTAQPFNETTYHTLLTYHQPLIVSCGSDGELGLEEPTATGAARLAMPKSGEDELIADDVTNRKK